MEAEKEHITAQTPENSHGGQGGEDRDRIPIAPISHDRMERMALRRWSHRLTDDQREKMLQRQAYIAVNSDKDREATGAFKAILEAERDDDARAAELVPSVAGGGVTVQVNNVWSRMDQYSREIEAAAAVEVREAEADQVSEADLASAGFTGSIPGPQINGHPAGHHNGQSLDPKNGSANGRNGKDH